MVGCFPSTDWPTAPATPDKPVDRWAPWGVLMEYLDRVESKALPASGPRPTLQQVRMADESTREMWNESVRLEGLSLGAAVIRSKLEAAPFWLWAGAEVDDRAQARDSVRADAAPRGSKGRARSRSRSPARSSGTVASSTSKGKPICPDWNSGKCTTMAKDCNQKMLHVCNKLLTNKQVCASASHRRCEAH